MELDLLLLTTIWPCWTSNCRGATRGGGAESNCTQDKGAGGPEDVELKEVAAGDEDERHQQDLRLAQDPTNFFSVLHCLQFYWNSIFSGVLLRFVFDWNLVELVTNGYDIRALLANPLK